MNSIIRYFMENRLLINLTILFIILSGLVSSFKIKQDVFPLTDIDTMIISVIYPGASPSDVEINTVIPIEEELSRIQGVQEYISLSIDNGALLYAYLDQDIDEKQKIKDEVYRKITKSYIPEIPGDVEEITIVDANPKQMAVFSVSLSGKEGKSFTEKELYDAASSLEKKFLRINGVSEIRKSGYRDREIHIDVKPDRMKDYYVSLNDIVRSIQSRNIRSTGGTIQSVHKEQNIVTIGQFSDPRDVGNVIIRSNFEEKRVRIKDIARVRDSFKKETVKLTVNNEKSVVLQFVKKENSDVVKTINNIKTYLKTNRDLVPDSFKITVIDDKSLQIDSLLNIVLSNAAIGFILVLLFMFIFLDLRTSFWTAFGIPVSLLMVISYMHLTGLSINIISLGAIITVLGMMVDHGIVIAEIIYEKRKIGLSPIEAVAEGMKVILKPVFVTIITTIVAFLPLLSVKGMMGKFVYIFPIIITATLIASFIEAVFILPNHLVHGTVKDEIKEEKKWFTRIMKVYESLLERALKFRYIVVLAFLLLLIGTVFITKQTISGFVLLWDDSADGIYINLEMPEGTSLNKTETETAKIEKMVLQKIFPKELQSIQRNTGHHTVKRINSKGNRENWSQIVVNLVPKAERKRSAHDIIIALSKTINAKKISDFNKISYRERVLGPAPGDAVDIKIISEDNKNGIKLMNEIITVLKGIAGVKGIDHDQKPGKEELIVDINYEKLAKVGLTVDTVANTVRTAYEGAVATSIQTADEELDFKVKIDDSYKRDSKFLKSLLVPNSTGNLIRLGEIANIKTEKGKSVINHYNGEKVITITAGIDRNSTTSSKVMQTVKQKFNGISQKYQGTEIIFGGESKETQKSIGDLKIAFILALVLIYFILIMLFKSLSQPFLILITIPFGLIGALLAFSIHGIPLSFMGVVGIIGLSGIVLNDSVVMVDFINSIVADKKNEDSYKISSLIIGGAKERLRPVLLTTLTTVAGLMPTVYGIGGDAKSLVPLVMAICYGLLFATFLTLLFLPSVYMINYDIKKLFSSK